MLVLEDSRLAVGRVEEVFGPVSQPFYVLRWAGTGDPPAGLAAGAQISTAPRLSACIAADLQLRGWLYVTCEGKCLNWQALNIETCPEHDVTHQVTASA